MDLRLSKMGVKYKWKAGTKMEYAYVICPKCWDKLIEVEKDEELSIYEQRRCPNCGTRFGLALLGENKIDSSVYKVIIKKKWGWDQKRTDIISKDLNRAHFDVEPIMESINNGTQGTIIYEGDVLHIYLFECVFIGFESWIEFEIVPRFPYKIFHPEYFLCPECGAEVISRQEPYDRIKGWLLDGLFCENCNEWTLEPTAIRDPITYKLVFTHKNVENMEDNSIKREIMNCLEKVVEKEIQGDQMIINTNSEGIIEIASYLGDAGYTYDIDPSFPHKID